MERKLNLIPLSSSLNENVSFDLDKRESVRLLRSIYKTNIVNPLNLDKIKDEAHLTALFIASGGSEEQFLKIAHLLPEPVIVISDSFHNSLAASVEISSWLNSKGLMHHHFNLPDDPSEKFMEDLDEELGIFERIQTGLKTISRYRIGLIGGESPWLISSAVNKERIQNRFGAVFHEISVNDLIEAYQNETYNDSDSLQLINSLESHKEEFISCSSIEDAVKMYNAINHICLKENLDAFTIKCFDLLKPCSTTACLALSLMNDNGIVAGCEGDIPSLWSMIISKVICDSTYFMANPSSVDRVDYSIDFAHCTAPLTIGKSYKLTTHYESKSGIGIASKVNLGKYTLFKCGGEDLNKFYLYEGEVIQNTSVVERCRTQVKFVFKHKEDLNEYLESYLGNHSVLIPGKHKKVLKRFITLISKRD